MLHYKHRGDVFEHEKRQGRDGFQAIPPGIEEAQKSGIRGR
jgi:hypothetical protein